MATAPRPGKKDGDMASESETLRKDMEELRASVEKLTKDMADLSQSWTNDMKSRAGHTAEALRDTARTVADEIGAKTKESAEVVEKTVRERPFQSLIAAFGAGLLLAQLLRR